MYYFRPNTLVTVYYVSNKYVLAVLLASFSIRYIRDQAVNTQLQDKGSKSLFRLLYSSTSIVQRPEISLEISGFCTLEISRHCTVEVDE